jgi:hypothetical protein
MPNPPFTHSNSGSLHTHDRRPEQGYERGYESRYRANHDDTQPSAVYQEPSYPPQEMPFQYQR